MFQHIIHGCLNPTEAITNYGENGYIKGYLLFFQKLFKLRNHSHIYHNCHLNRCTYLSKTTPTVLSASLNKK